MDFTFGIITNRAITDLVETVKSIEKQMIPNYEIIVVGGSLGDFYHPNIKHIPFNELIKPSWITKKKNLIIKNSSFDNIVFLHDYIILSDGWYGGHLKSGNDFDIRMDIILNADGTRFRDWCLWPDNQVSDGTSTEDLIKSSALLPYEINNLSKFQYISGSYWVAKKTIMEEYPLNEDLLWGESEDVEWSKRVRLHYTFTMNTKSIVQFKKQKSVVFNLTTNEIIKKLDELV
jgi:glycosyltransferase involved in cell wall biosynthesis